MPGTQVVQPPRAGSSAHGSQLLGSPCNSLRSRSPAVLQGAEASGGMVNIRTDEELTPGEVLQGFSDADAQDVEAMVQDPQVGVSETCCSWALQGEHCVSSAFRALVLSCTLWWRAPRHAFSWCLKILDATCAGVPQHHQVDCAGCARPRGCQARHCAHAVWRRPQADLRGAAAAPNTAVHRLSSSGREPAVTCDRYHNIGLTAGPDIRGGRLTQCACCAAGHQPAWRHQCGDRGRPLLRQEPAAQVRGGLPPPRRVHLRQVVLRCRPDRHRRQGQPRMYPHAAILLQRH